MVRLLIVGLPFFPHKYDYVVDSYKKIGVDVKVLLNNDFDASLSEKEFIYFAGWNKFKRIYSYFLMLKKFKPSYLDCYDYSVFSLFYLLTAKLLKINTRYWLIGWELVGDTQNTNSKSIKSKLIIKTKMYLSRLCLRVADTIYAKEHHHLETIKEINKNLLEKVINVYNCVPVENHFRSINDLNNKIDFLYANAVIEKRNVIELLESFSELKEKKYTFKAFLYGFNSISNEVYSTRGVDYSSKAMDIYNQLNIADCVEVFGFSKNIKEVMLNSKFFILPADIILANYALLESMAVGVVPIVYAGDGHDVIVKNGCNGFVAYSLDELSLVLEKALQLTDKEYLRMSHAAQETIIKNFSLETWQEKLKLNINMEKK